MIKKIKILTITFLLFNFMSPLIAEDNFFEKGVIKYGEEKYEESKFLFQRNIVFNPADTKSYLFFPFSKKLFSAKE